MYPIFNRKDTTSPGFNTPLAQLGQFFKLLENQDKAFLNRNAGELSKNVTREISGGISVAGKGHISPDRKEKHSHSTSNVHYLLLL